MFGDLAVYGSDAPAIQDLLHETKSYNEQLHPNLPIRSGEVIWAVRHEMARTIEDFLSRRTRALLLDAKITMAIAPKVADLMAKELGRNRSWKQEQVRKYNELAGRYLL